MKHRTFFGDDHHIFALTDPMITELERLADMGIGAIYARAVNMQFRLADLTEIIRLGLIGGGADPATAMRLVDAYARNQPLENLYPLALDILDARWTGTPEKESPNE